MASSKAVGTTALVGVAHAAIAYLFHEHAPEAYMDEIFHFPQTQQYCNGHWDAWDNKITTFPGLYVLGVGYANVIHIIQTFLVSIRIPFCSLAVLRTINLVFAMGNLYLILLLRQMKEYTQLEQSRAVVHGLMIAFFPINVFFSFLYYTDAAALFFVLLMYYLSLRSKQSRLRKGIFSLTNLTSVLCGYIAVAIRQTNIIWVLFVLGTAIVDDIETTHENHLYMRPSEGSVIDSPSIGIILVKFTAFLLKDFFRLFKLFWPYISIVIAFSAFLVVNGSITVGDKENHVAGFHVAQLLYFITIATAGFGLVCAFPVRLLAFLRDMASMFTSGPRKLLTSLCLIAALVFAIHRFSIVHPFLLADNRHYTFYVWNRFFLNHELLKFVPLPLYMYAGWFLFKELRKVNTPLWLVVFGIAVSLVLIPTPLVEPRYYLVPYTLLHLHTPKQPMIPLLLTSITCMIVNAVTIYVYLFRPFTWVDGTTARFMW